MSNSAWRVNGHVIGLSRNMIEVTSNSRPDERWHFVDKAGHEHRWYTEKGVPMESYCVETKYYAPTTKRVEVGEYVDEIDGSVTKLFEDRCICCDEEIRLGYRADESAVYIAGIKRLTIDGRPATVDDVNRLLMESGSYSFLLTKE